MWFTVLAALAAPPDYQHVKDTDDCRLSQGPTERDGVAPMLAECHWPAVDPSALVALLARYDSYDDYIFPIERSEVVRTEGARSLVHQVARTKGIASREVLLWMERVDQPDGAVRFTWDSDAEEPLAVEGNHVRAPRNDGYWQVAPHPQGGARVEHFIAYDPGGNVPSWVVRWAQTGGLVQVLTEMHAYARGAAPLPGPGVVSEPE